MKTVLATGKFKKDVKRYQNMPEKMKKLYGIIKLLAEGKILPHMLAGNYSGFMECHIENDLLLIWLDDVGQTIKLIRLGTHSELFK